MMMRVRHGVVAMIVTIGLACAAEPEAIAQDGVAHYVSVDDLQYMRDGVIRPVHEYVEITTVPDGPDRIEVGYQHIGMSSNWLITYLAFSFPDGSLPADPAVFGRLDPMNQRRIGLLGKVSVAGEGLTWAADELHPVDAFRTVPGGDPRPSPFLGEGTQAQLEFGDRANPPGGDVAAVLGDGFTLTANGRQHSYRRVDPRHLQLADFLAMATNSSIASTRDCMADIAEVYLDGRPYRFNEATIAEAAEMLGDSAGWPIIQERGAGTALSHFLDAALAAQSALNERVAGEIETAGLMALIEAEAGLPVEGLDEDWRTERRLTQRVIEGLHILPGDPRFPEPPVNDVFPILVERSVAAYEADPWSQTGPFVSAMAGGGWVSGVLTLVWTECLPQ